MPDITFTPDKQPIQAVRIVPPTTVRTIGGNPVRAVRLTTETANDVITPAGYPIQSVRTYDAAGVYTASQTPIVTQPEDVFTVDGEPIEHVRIIAGASSPELSRTTDGWPIDAVRLVDATGQVVGPGNLYDFSTGTLPAGVTFTRSSTAWGFNSAGVLTSYATDAPRFVYDPTTLANLGLLVEGQRINSLPNSTAVGAVVGTPGTVPTGWSIAGTLNAVTRTIVGVGIEDGIEYIDIQYSGTPSATSSISIGPTGTGTHPAAVSGQVWSCAWFLRLMAGSLTNITGNVVFLTERDVGGGALVNTTVPLSPTSAALRTQRFVVTRTLNNASTIAVSTTLGIAYTLGNAIDITLRIGLPQLELSEGATSPVKTSTVAVTRAADTANITDARVLTDAAWVLRGRACNHVPTINAGTLFQIDDGTAAQRNLVARVAAGTNIASQSVPGPVAMTAGAAANDTDVAIATRFALNNFAVSMNGAAVVTDTAGVMPIGLTTARVGRGNSGNGHYWSSTIKSIETRATASDAELQALSRLTPEGIYDFSAGAMPTGVSFTRASTAWGFDRNGMLQSYATDAPRFVYDPVTLANLGLLVEGVRTNSIRNSTAVGAVAGTPGTAPTNWTVTSAANAVTRTIVGTGVEDGIDYIDIQYSGTPTATASMIIQADGVATVAATGQVWTGSAYVRVVGGSMTNVTSMLVNIVERVAGAFNTSTPTLFTPTSAALRTQRYISTRTFINATTDGATTDVRFSYTIALPIDITLRIGLPQLELGAGATSPVKTSTVAVTRARDDAFITDARALTDAALIVKARAPSYTDAVSAMVVVARDDSTSTNILNLRRSTTGIVQFNVTTASVSQVALQQGAVADNADFALAVRLATNNAAGSLNGSAALTDATVTPPTVTIFRVGASTSLSQVWNSTIRSIETRATASDAELVTLSAAPVASDTELWMTAVATNGGSVSAARKAIVDAFIAAEKAAGTWDLTDDYWPLWAENAPQSLTSLKRRVLCTAVNAPAFVADRGYTSDGTTSYINTGFVCATHAVQMTGINMRIGVYIRGNVGSGGQIAVGAVNNSTQNLQIIPRTASNIMTVQLSCQATGPGGDTTTTDSRGYSVGSRTNGSAAVNITAYKNAVALVPFQPGTIGTLLTTQPLFLCAACQSTGLPTGFYTPQVSFATVGASLTPAQEAAQYTNVQAWAMAIGANV